MHLKKPYPAFLTAPVQLNEAAGFLDPFGDPAPSPGSSSLTAVVSDIRSSSLICNNSNKGTISKRVSN